MPSPAFWSLVDLHFRRVDIGDGSPGTFPHASDRLRYRGQARARRVRGHDAAVDRRAARRFGGGIVRKETTSDLLSGTEVEPGTEPIRERYAFPLVAGLKVGLPVP